MTNLLSPEPEAPKLTFTLNEVVVRLLGWTPQDLRYGKHISSSLGSAGKARIDLDEPYIDVLNDRYEEASKMYELVVVTVRQPKVTSAVMNIIRSHVSEVERAKDYEFDILRELEKGAESQLKVDFQATRDRGQICLHRRGIVGWVQENYQKDFFPAPKIPSLAESFGLVSKKRTIDYDSVDSPVDGDLVSASALVPETPKSTADNDASDQFENRKESEGLSRTVADNLYITLALLIERYAQVKGGKYKKSHGGVNVKNVAVDVLAVLEEANKDKPLPGQRPRTIVGHITEALRTKDQTQRELYGSRSSK